MWPRSHLCSPYQEVVTSGQDNLSKRTHWVCSHLVIALTTCDWTMLRHGGNRLAVAGWVNSSQDCLQGNRLKTLDSSSLFQKQRNLSDEKFQLPLS